MTPAAPCGPSLWRGAALRRGLATLLVAVVAALAPALSAAPADATRSSVRTTAAATTHGSATAPGRSTSHESRRAMRPAANRSGSNRSRSMVGQRSASDAGAQRTTRRPHGATVHQPTCPATGSIDATGPPTSYGVATFRPGTRPAGRRHHPAAAGRAPPLSCGS